MQSAATIHLHKAERNCQMGIRAGGVNASVLPVRFGFQSFDHGQRQRQLTTLKSELM